MNDFVPTVYHTSSMLIAIVIMPVSSIVVIMHIMISIVKSIKDLNYFAEVFLFFIFCSL